MLARWYLLLGQFSFTFEYRPGAQHANADGMSRQCGQCQRPDCPVSATDSPVPDADPETEMVDQPFAASEMGESMDADLLPELSGEILVASALIEEFKADLLPAASNVDLITADKAFRYSGPGFCGVCDTRIYSALDAHMIACHLELDQLSRYPVTYFAGGTSYRPDCDSST